MTDTSPLSPAANRLRIIIEALSSKDQHLPAKGLSPPTTSPSGLPGGPLNPLLVSPITSPVRSPQVAPATRGTATTDHPLRTYGSKSVQTTPSLNKISLGIIEISSESEDESKAPAKGKNIPVNLAHTDGSGDVAHIGPLKTKVGDGRRPRVTYMDDSSSDEDWSRFMPGQYPPSPQPLSSPQLTISKIQSYSNTPSTPPHQVVVSPAQSYSHTPTPAQRPPNSKYTPKCRGKQRLRTVIASSPEEDTFWLGQEAGPSRTLKNDYNNVDG